MLVLAHILPGVLNVGHRACVDSLSICEAQLEKHVAIKGLSIDYLWSRSLVDARTKGVNLLCKLRPELRVRQRLQLLQVKFVFHRPYHCKAVTVLEELFNHAADSVLLLDGVAESFLGLQRILQILLLTNLVVLLVDKPETKVSDNPKKRWEVFLDLFWFTLA